MGNKNFMKSSLSCGKGRGPFSDMSGKAKQSLLTGLLICLAMMGFLLTLNEPVQAGLTSLNGSNSCMTSGCHSTVSSTGTISSAVNGAAASSVTVTAGQGFEIDWMFSIKGSKNSVGPEIIVPQGWGVAAGTLNSPNLANWDVTYNSWDRADGVGWSQNCNATGDGYPNTTCYSINYANTSWDSGSRDTALDNATAGDLDHVSNRMGTDAMITVPVGTAPGTYTVTIEGIGHDANARTHVERAITVMVQAVAKQTPTINSWPTASAITYGQALSSSTLTGGSASVPGTFAWNTPSTVPLVGSPAQAVRFTPTDTTNYNTVDGTVPITVNPKALTITAAAKSKVYGAVDPALTYTATGLVGTDTTSGSLTRVAGENVGTYAINQGTVTAGANYTITYAGANLSITAKPLTITAAAKSKVYGTADPALTYTATGLVGSDTTSGSLTRAAGENAGTYAISQGTVTAGTNYTITYVGANLTITPAPLTVTADPKTKVAGSGDPALTYTITSGALVGSDAFTGALSRDPGETVGLYPIRQNTLALNSNYALTYVGNNLEITAAPKQDQTISFSPLAAKTYGNGDFDPGATASSGLLVSYTSSNPAVATIVGGLVHIVGAGTTTITASQAGNATYNPAPSVPQSQLVNTATLTITAAAMSKVYGAADPALTYTAAGLVGSDTTSGSLTRSAGENVGSYAINQGTVSASSNYTITYVSANLSITAKALTIAAGAKSKVYGAADPALTYVATGLVGSDTTSGSLTRAAGENVGSYGINQGTVSASSNYTITYTGANLSITAKPITVVADAQSKVYGAADPALTYVATGLVGSDTTSGSLTRAAGENVGTYAINQGTVTAGSNYSITYTSANLSVTAKPLAITADSKSKVYGAADPALTFTATGLVGSDTTSGSLTRVAGENVGSYAISQGTLTASSNYSITYTGANLSVTVKPLTITAAAKSKVYGSADPALTYTTAGLVGSDTTSGSLTRAAGESVGSYAINQGTVSAGSNYTVTYTGANLSITPASLTVTADNKTRAVGAADPIFTATYSGFVNGDTAAVVNGAPTFSTTATPASPAGTYPITPALGTLAAANYTFTTFVDGTLTITAAAGPYRLSVSVAGSGSGSVHSNDGNISCTGTTGCSYDYPSGTPVTLTVTTSSGSVFAGWSGACTGTGDCNVTMDATKDVTATFNTTPLARIGNIDYPTFWDAYAAIDPLTNGVIQVRDIAMPGGVFTKPGIIFDGGYDALWNKTSVTPVTGVISINEGTLTVDGMSIQ